MSRETFERLNTVVGSFTGQRAQIANQLKLAQAATAELDPEVRAACDVIIKKLVHPQSAAQILTSAFQAVRLQDTLDEIDSVIAAVQVAQGDLSAIARQMVVNAEAITSPQQPAVAGTGGDAPSAAGTGNEDAVTIAAEISQEGAANEEADQAA